MAGSAWSLSDGVVTIRPTEGDDVETLIAGRDSDSERWFGVSDRTPHPTACVVVDGEVIGWVDYDTDQEWLGPRSVNVGYNIFRPHRRQGYATRAVRLLLRYLAQATDTSQAYLAVDADNLGSLRVADGLGAEQIEEYRNDEGRLQIKFVLPVVASGAGG